MKAAATVLILLVIALGAAPPAQAQLAAPGLSLDRSDLPEVGYAGYAAVKGLKSATGVTVGGAIAAGVGYSTTFNLCIGNCASGTSSSLAQSLLPPFASGEIAIGILGGAVQLKAAIFEPDQLKRKTTSSQTTAKLKQKNYLGIRIWTRGILVDTTYRIAAIEGCKGQADVRKTLGVEERVTKFKMSCKNGALDDLLNGVPIVGDDQAALAAFLKKAGLKNKVAFDLQGKQLAP